MTYSQERLDALYRDLGERLNRVPGIERSTLALYAPLTDNWGELILVAGHPAPSINDDNSSASWDRVSPVTSKPSAKLSFAEEVSPTPTTTERPPSPL